MRFSAVFWSFTAVLLAFSVCTDQAAAVPACKQFTDVSEIAQGVYVRPGKYAVVFEDDSVANIGFIVGDRCVAVIDTGGSYTEGQALRCAIQRVTPRPVCFVINTHAHPDHVLGNLAFKQEGASFIGHEKLARAMALRGGFDLKRATRHTGRPLGPEHVVLPERSVTERLDLDLGKRVLRVIAHPTAHTDQDLSVYDEKTGTLWLSDLLFIDHVPVIDGSLKGWLSVLEGLAAQPAMRVVPGHGPAQAPWPFAAQPQRRYFLTLRDETRAWIARGGGLKEAQDKIGYAEKKRWRLFTRYHRRNVIAAFTELEWEE